MQLLLLLFILVPLMEIWVLLKVGGAIGALSTITLVVLTAVIGVALLRRQGLQTLLRARGRLDQGEMPAGEMVEGILLAVGGALLLTPGFITDTVGFCCLIPGVRRALVGRVLRQVSVRQGGAAGKNAEHAGSHTIEGEYRREDPPQK